MATAKQLKARYRRGELIRAFLFGLARASEATISLAVAPYAGIHIEHYLRRRRLRLSQFDRKTDTRLLSDAFGYLKRRGLIKTAKVSNQLYISLTAEGRARAKYYQIDGLEIGKPRVWDKRWRVLMFDIPEKRRVRREALRGKLKQLGFVRLQHSVWIHPYDCNEEIALLRSFLGFKPKHCLLIVTDNIGPRTKELVKHYKLVV